MKKIISITLVALLLSACTHRPTPSKTNAGGVVGGVGGALLGALVGGSLGMLTNGGKDSKAPIIGVVIGGALGGLDGYNLGNKIGDALK